MAKEQIVYRKKLFRSDGMMFVCIMLGILAYSLLSNYIVQVLQIQMRLLQAAVFLGIAVLCYFIVTRQMTGFRYVLKEGVFQVYRIVGKRQTLTERVELKDVEFLCPYYKAPGRRGREHALCAGEKQAAYVLAHTQKGKPQWLLFSPNEEMLTALNGSIAAARASAAQPEQGD